MNNYVKLLISAALLGTSPLALASGGAPLHCTAPDGNVLTLTPGEAGAATASLETPQAKRLLHGTFHTVTQSVFTVVHEYDLTDAAGATYTVEVSYHTPVGRGGCGRAGCPPVGSPGASPSIHADLQAGDEQTFSCEQATDDPS